MTKYKINGFHHLGDEIELEIVTILINMEGQRQTSLYVIFLPIINFNQLQRRERSMQITVGF